MYNNRFKKEDPFAGAPKTTKWRLKKQMLETQAVNVPDDSDVFDDAKEDIAVLNSSNSSTSRVNYNARFKEDDPMECAPKTTKWRLKRRCTDATLNEMSRKSQDIEDGSKHMHQSANLNTIEGNSHLESMSDFQIDKNVLEETLTMEEDSDEEFWFDCSEENSMWSDCAAEDIQDVNSFTYEATAEDDDESKPIYEGSSLTVAQSALLILTFSLRHNLTGECMSDLLTLISLHCVTTNIIHSSLYAFRAFFSNLKSHMIFHKYCTICECSLTQEAIAIDTCPNCAINLTVGKNISYFVEIPLAQQIQQLFKRKQFHQDLQHRHTRSKKSQHNIEDIYDGDLYKTFSQKNAFLDNPNNISFMWYTDGVPLFKSSKVSIWPLFLSINELPYHDRMKPENMLFAGLWYGKSKPSMSVYLKPFYESLKQLYEDGTTVECGHCVKSFIVKGLLLCGTCDLPAKCLMMNMTQFNGKYGCPRCKQEGVVVKTGKGHTRAFPFQENLVDASKRTHSEFIQHGEDAYASSSVVFGVKGPSWWVNISADIIHGTAIDYMHTVLLGVVRRLLKLWFDTKFSSEAFSVSNLVDIADKRLTCIKPPNFIKRHPRSIKEHSQYWKASECRAWLFYYSVPVLFGILKKELFEHYLLFVDAIFIMNLDSISSEDLVHSEELLMKFCCLFSTLYGVNNMSANLHQLLHLHDVVRQLGPLWVYSCFSFESMNGKLLKLFHGTQSAAVQIANTVTTIVQLPILGQDLDTESSVSKFYCKLSNANHGYKITETISESVHILGATHQQNIQPKYYEVVAQALRYAPVKCFVFYRMLIRGVLYLCSTHKIVARNSYTVQFKIGDQTCVGQIVFYVKCFPACDCIVKYGWCKCAQFLAVVRKISVERNYLFIPDAIVTPKLTNIMSGVLTNDYVAIAVTDIVDLCTFVDFYRQDKKVYVCVRPNKKEID